MKIKAIFFVSFDFGVKYDLCISWCHPSSVAHQTQNSGSLQPVRLRTREKLDVSGAAVCEVLKQERCN